MFYRVFGLERCQSSKHSQGAMARALFSGFRAWVKASEQGFGVPARHRTCSAQQSQFCSVGLWVLGV